MKNDKEHKYVLIPLSSIKRLYTHPQTAINDLFHIGIKCVADHLKTDLRSSIKQLMYCYYHEPDEITGIIDDTLVYLKRENFLETNDDYGGFTSKGFSPDKEIQQIEKYINIFYDNEVADIICNFNRIRSVKKVLNIEFNTGHTMTIVEKLQKDFIKNDAFISVKTTLLFDFLQHTKTQYEIDMLACYLGIRSILGKKDFVYTTKKYIVCRMIGVKSPAQLSTIRDKKLLKVHEKYSKRHHIDKMLDTLVYRKFIVKLPVPQFRRIYFSTRLTIDELGESIYNSITNNKQTQISQTKQREKEVANVLLSKLLNFRK